MNIEDEQHETALPIQSYRCVCMYVWMYVSERTRDCRLARDEREYTRVQCR